MSAMRRGFAAGWTSLAVLLRGLGRLGPTLASFSHAVRRSLTRQQSPSGDSCCLPLPPSEYKRADPLLYSQFYLMAQGLAVTWNNPDITLYDEGGDPVDSGGLLPARDYRVVVRIWNNSYDAPAIGLPVNLSMLSFGIGTSASGVGATTVNLGVKGSSHCPAYATFIWRTPDTPGHYCLQVLLDWSDDANPDNNLGQENTQVGEMHSPATFTLSVHNDAGIARDFELETDCYDLRSTRPCSEPLIERPRPGGLGPRHLLPADRLRVGGMSRLEESRRRWDATRQVHSYGGFAVGDEWRVTIDPPRLRLEPGASEDVRVSIERVAGDFSGQQRFNVHGFATDGTGDRTLAGGVTLIVAGR